MEWRKNWRRLAVMLRCIQVHKQRQKYTTWQITAVEEIWDMTTSSVEGLKAYDHEFISKHFLEEEWDN